MGRRTGAATGVRTDARLSTDEVWAAIDVERVGLADLLDDLAPSAWDAESLCDAWRVRDVAAHLTLAHMGPGAALVGLVRAGGSPNGMIRDTALRQSRLPAGELASRLRAMAGSRRHAPGVGHLEPLLDVLVHGQDIAQPLGLRRPVPSGPGAAAASRVWARGWPWHARRRYDGLRFRATDVSWEAGDGPPVEGPVGAVLLVLTGRAAGLDALEGEGLAELRRRVPGPRGRGVRGGRPVS